MKVIIIEDEILSAKWLNSLLMEYAKKNNKIVEVVAYLETVEDAIKWFLENKTPDLIFLDIHLHFNLSFDIFKNIKILCPVIFTTAYSQYINDSFKLNNIAYLLKPLNQTEVENALNKYKELKEFNQEVISKILIKNDWNTNSIREPIKYIQVRHANILQTIEVRDIAYFFVKDKMIYLKTYNSVIRIVSRSLEQLNEELSTKYFFQINRQMIVNFSAIDNSLLRIKFSQGSIKLTPKHEIETKISRNRLKSFKQWMSRN